MEWKVEYTKEAQKDLIKLDDHSRKLVLKAIEKTAERPLPPPDGIGKPLGNHSAAKLSGYYKIKLKARGLRVVYGLIRTEKVMRIIIVSVRSDEEVYIEAEKRIKEQIKGLRN